MKKLQCVIHSPSDNTSLIKKRIAQTLINETSNLSVSIKSPFETIAEDILNPQILKRVNAVITIMY